MPGIHYFFISTVLNNISGYFRHICFLVIFWSWGAEILPNFRRGSEILHDFFGVENEIFHHPVCVTDQSLTYFNIHTDMCLFLSNFSVVTCLVMCFFCLRFQCIHAYKDVLIEKKECALLRHVQLTE